MIAIRCFLALAAVRQQLPSINIPEPVRRAWEATYSGAAQWHAAPDHSYEAIFVVRGVRTGTRYNASGQLLETRVAIAAVDLPERVKKSVIRDLRGYHILEVWRVDPPGKQPSQFMVECDNRRGAVSARFDVNGKLVSRVAVPKTHAKAP